MTPDAVRLAADLDHFASLSAGTGRGVTRLAYTELERTAHRYFTDTLEPLGYTVTVDAAGNTIAERPGRVPGAVGTGSHLDSVPVGGGFDGIAGVVAAMEVARMFADSGVTLEHPLRIVAFAAEEGARFGQACTGSRAVAGRLTPGRLRELVDVDGVSMFDAMAGVGLDPGAIGSAAWNPADWKAFVELHIEQGVVLERSGTPVGLVDVVSGSTRSEYVVRGTASHSGGTPMPLRRDAMAAAAEMVLLAERLASEPGRDGLRATVGRLDVHPGSLTTIPGEVVFGLDIRDVDPVRQRETAREFESLAARVCGDRGVELESHSLADASPVVLPSWVRSVAARSAEALGVEYRTMPSGASHDAQMVNEIVPTGMIFVPSKNGISHAPEEETTIADLVPGVRVLARTLLDLDSRA